jgi:hypothetical protein
VLVEVLASLAAVCDHASGTAGVEEPDQVGFEAGGPSWSTMLVGCDIFGLLATCLQASLEDDTLLEAVALAGSLAGHAQLAQDLADSGTVSGQVGICSSPRMHASLSPRLPVCLLHACCVSATPPRVPLANTQLHALADIMALKRHDDEFVLQVGPCSVSAW